jgi:LPXTG-motif cell wall-anchored protein
MRVRRTGLVLMLSAVALTWFSMAAPAAHASYGGDGGLTISPTSVHAGGSLTIDSSGWHASSSVTVTLHSDPVVLGTVNADASGNVHATLTVPAATEPGAHTIVATGTGASGSPQEASTSVTVMAASSGGGSGSLPRTGAAIGALGLVGLGLFGGGALLSRARKRAAH